MENFDKTIMNIYLTVVCILIPIFEERQMHLFTN